MYMYMYMYVASVSGLPHCTFSVYVFNCAEEGKFPGTETYMYGCMESCVYA